MRNHADPDPQPWSQKEKELHEQHMFALALNNINSKISPKNPAGYLGSVWRLPYFVASPALAPTPYII